MFAVGWLVRAAGWLGGPHECEWMPELGEHAPKCGGGQPDDRVEVALDTVDECRGATVDRESAGARERLSSGDVRVEFLIADVRETNRGGHTLGGLAASFKVDQAMPRMKHAFTASLSKPSFPRYL